MARAPETLIAADWADYRLIDSGAGAKLEQAGPYVFVRPEPQALWARRDPALWERADAVFSPAASDDEESGRWRFNRELAPHWSMHWDDIKFLSRPTPFRHLSFFPEHSVHWRFAREALARHKSDAPPEVLNLFGYTGLASLVCAAAGARVTHVDASKRAIGFARENAAEAGLADAPIRWICDDAGAFVRREARRAKRYQGVILDPPKFGRGPKGETWKLEDSLRDLVAACAEILAPDGPGRFIILTSYAVRLSALALVQTAEDASGLAGWRYGDMTLAHARDDRLLPTANYARWSGA
jgi:23S rRNA (cytosine1962-C5)-methyltransferase